MTQKIPVTRFSPPHKQPGLIKTGKNNLLSM